MLYDTMTESKFIHTFWESPHNSKEYMVAAYDSQENLLGFAVGLTKKFYLQGENFENTPGYLSMVLVSPEHQRQGIGTELLKELERRFVLSGKTKIAVTYRNPMMLTWNIPGTSGPQHNNAPGVWTDSPAYSFFIKNGYQLLRTEHGMYLPLANYVIPDRIRSKETALLKSGIAVEHWDASFHTGFEELFDALHGEVWRQTIRENQLRSHPLPVLVAAEKNRIVGFAGPIDREPNGRGWFNGIGTHPDYEGRGIGSVLFYRLMEEFSQIGAEYSTLFTDEENSALHLYQAAGFRTAAKFAVMEKEV